MLLLDALSRLQREELIGCIGRLHDADRALTLLDQGCQRVFVDGKILRALCLHADGGLQRLQRMRPPLEGVGGHAGAGGVAPVGGRIEAAELCLHLNELIGHALRLGNQLRGQRERGAQLADDVEVRVWDSTAELRYLVLPERPPGTEKMTEDELAALVTRDSMVGVAKVTLPGGQA